MIRFFRDNVQGNIAKVFIILICIPFVLTGVDSLFTSRGEPKAAKVDGEAITQREVDREIQSLVNRIASMQGEDFDPSSVDPATLQPRAIENMVGKKLLQNLADDLGIVASDSSIDKTILEQPFFQSDGQFSESLYLNLLRTNGLSSNAYKSLVAEDLVISQVGSVLRSAAFVTDAEVEAMVKLDYQTRDLAYISFDQSSIATDITLTDDDVRAYFDDNTDQFMTEEVVSVDYVELRIQDLFVEVDEADLQQAYEQHIQEMVLPTQRQAAHILIEFDGDDERAAAETSLLEAKSRLAAGESFEALAAELSQDAGTAQNGGDLGYTSGDLFPAAFEEALAALGEGEVSEPVETEAGLHLIKLLGVETADKPSLESLRPMLSEQLQRLEASTRFEEQLELLRDLSFDSDSMQDIAAELGVTLQRSERFTAQGAGAGLFGSTDLVGTAFSDEVKTEGRISEVIEISADQYVVMQRAEHIAPELKAFDTVASSIRLQLQAEAEQEALAAKAEAAIAAVLESGSLDAYASANALELQAFDDVSRREAKGADRQVINAAFTTAVTDGIGSGSVVLRDGQYAVFAVSDVKVGDISTLDAQAIEGSKALLNSLRTRADADAFEQSMRERAKVELL